MSVNTIISHNPFDMYILIKQFGKRSWKNCCGRKCWILELLLWNALGDVCKAWFVLIGVCWIGLVHKFCAWIATLEIFWVHAQRGYWPHSSGQYDVLPVTHDVYVFETKWIKTTNIAPLVPGYKPIKKNLTFWSQSRWLSIKVWSEGKSTVNPE